VSLLLDTLAWIALLAGGFFIIVGSIGLHRMPDVFTRMHATSLIDTLGVGLLGLGMLLQTDDWMVAIRVVIIVVVLLTTGAVSAHALARAAMHAGERPLLAGSDGVLRPTSCASIYPELGVRLAQPLVSEQVEQSTPLPVPHSDEPLEPEARREGPEWSS
jgi:multicomponent Na+:H+ antiporter subunit G